MIRAVNYISETAKREAEQQAIGALMNAFTDGMVHELTSKLDTSYAGWDNGTTESVETLKSRLADSINNQDWVDVANIAMFLWNLRQK
jgi:hypothetical protein